MGGKVEEERAVKGAWSRQGITQPFTRIDAGNNAAATTGNGWRGEDDDVLAWALGSDGRWTRSAEGGEVDCHVEMERLTVERALRQTL